MLYIYLLVEWVGTTILIGRDNAMDIEGGHNLHQMYSYFNQVQLKTQES